MPQAPRLLVAALFALLMLATVGAFVHAQRVKSSGLVLDRVRVSRGFSPNGDGHRDTAYVRFRLTRRDIGDVQIINRYGNVVSTLASNQPLRPYFYWVFNWDGRTAIGQVAPAGIYRLRVVLHDQDRDLVSPNQIHLYNPPPKPPKPSKK
jgi:flagellar hook assembly protein FlgD